MANYARYAVTVVVVIGVVCEQAFAGGVYENADRNVLGLNVPYGRGLDNEQLAKLLLTAPRVCHLKRNSELINSLLGLPKNMNNAGK